MTADPGYTVRLVAVTGAAFVTVLGARLSRRAEIIEDGGSNAGVGQGIIYMLPDPTSPNPQIPNWIGPFQIEPQTEPIRLGNPASDSRQFGNILCNGPGHVMGIGDTPALPLIQIKSAGSSTNIRVTEFS